MCDAEHGNGTDRVCPNSAIAYPIHLQNVEFQFSRFENERMNNEKVIWLSPKWESNQRSYLLHGP